MSEAMCTCGRPTAGAVLCPDCQPTLAIAIGNVSAYYVDLSTIATKAARYGSQGATKGSLGKAQPLPVDNRFLDVTGDGTQVRYDVWASVVAWCRVVMEDQPQVHGPVCVDCIHGTCALIRRRRWPRNTIRSMCAYFDRQFRWIIREEWAAVFLDEMLDNEKRLRRLVDRPADRWYAGRCSATDLSDALCTAELYALADRGTVVCRACATVHDIATRRDFLLAEAKDYLVTATEAAGALLAWTDYDGSETKLVDRIRKWAAPILDDKGHVIHVPRLRTSGKIERLGRDRALYRLGDIQELMVESAQHAQRRHLDKTA